MLFPAQLSQVIKEQALILGFDAVGITPCVPLDDHKSHYQSWIKKGFHAGMGYLERNVDKRLDPLILVEGAKSVIVLLMNYFPETKLPDNENYILAKYAYGEDYHEVIRTKLNLLIDKIKEIAGETNTRGFVDSAPVLERAWAVRAGLGWIGKNTCLIHPQKGSFFFISEIITDLELEYDHHRESDMCGSCRRCIDACPTGALVEPKVLDARRCISYLTIENKNEISAEFKDKFNDRIFGCDICQDVCPWNHKALPHNQLLFKPLQELVSMTKNKWFDLSQDDFNNLFRRSAVKRAKYKGLMRSIKFVGDENE